MSKEQESRLNAVFTFLDQHSEEYGEDWISKVNRRATVVEDPERPGQIVFDVERHRGVLGERYEEGESMGCFITYWERFAFDPEAMILTDLGVQRPSEFHFDAGYDRPLEHFSFMVERLANGKFLVQESFWKVNEEVEDLAKAEDLAEKIVDEICLEVEIDEASGALGPDQGEEYIEAIRSIFKEVLVEKLHAAWSDMETEE